MERFGDITVSGETTPKARLKSGADGRDLGGDSGARRDFRPTGSGSVARHPTSRPIAHTPIRRDPADLRIGVG
jgi:hypothetical protein